MTPEDLAALAGCAASVNLDAEHEGQRADALLPEPQEPGWDAEAEAEAEANRAVLHDRSSPGRRHSRGGGAPQAPPSAVYVGRLHLRVTEAILAELMTQVGPLRAVTMPAGWEEQQAAAAEAGAAALSAAASGDPTDRRGIGCAVVTYQDTACVDYAASVMDGVALYGCPIAVHAAAAGAWSLGPDICLRNLPHHIRERSVTQLVEAVVPLVVSTRMLGDELPEDQGGGFSSHGICFVTLLTVADAADAIIMLNGRAFGARNTHSQESESCSPART